MTYTQKFGALLLSLAMQSTAFAQEAPMPPLRPDQLAFRALYKELVETNTTLSAGSCTLLARAHGRAPQGAPASPTRTCTLFSVPDHPKEGGLVAVLAGSSSAAKPMLLLGHLDVVEAKREDWTRDPFTLIEENGYFYGRGAADMKAMDATWVDMLMRFKQERLSPQAHHQAGADLRRGDHLCLQRRPVAGEEQARTDRRRIRAE